MSEHKSMVHLPSAESIAGPSAIFRAAAIEFGSRSRSIWHMQDQADLAETMAAHPSETLPCSLSTISASGILPGGLADTISMPVKILHCFVTYILASLTVNADQPLQTILAVTEAKRDSLLAQYSSSFSTAAQTDEDNTSVQLLHDLGSRKGRLSASRPRNSLI